MKQKQYRLNITYLEWLFVIFIVKYDTKDGVHQNHR